MTLGANNKLVGMPSLRRCSIRLLAWLAVAVAVACAFAAGTSLAQPSGDWSIVLGGDGDDFAHGVALSGDGGFVIAGETGSYGAGSQDAWLVKLNSEGDEVWSRTFGGSEGDIAFSVQRTLDGGYVLAGKTHSFGGATASSSNFWLIKTDSEGQEEWQRSFPNSADLDTSSPSSDIAYAVRQSADGGYMMVGSSASATGTLMKLLKTDSTGETQWDRTVGESSGTLAYDLAQTEDGGFVVAGSTATTDSGSDAFLVKVGANGDTEWTSSLGGGYNDEARSLVLAADGGFALGGFTWSIGAGLSDFWLLKADSEGNMQWQRSFGGLPRDAAHSLVQTADGGFALAGWSESFAGGDRLWVVKTDESGGLQWSSAHRAESDESASGSISAGARAIRQTDEGGFMVAGWSGTIRGARDILAVKLAPVGEAQPAPTGASVTLTNTGTASITSAAVGFDTVFFGQPLRFWYEGRLVGLDNPLPTGEVACTQPAPRLVSGSVLSLDQFGSFEAVYIDALANDSATTAATVDGEGYIFDHNGISGTLEVASESPCESGDRLLPEGPKAPVSLSGSASGSHPGSITLNWAANPETDIFGYAVYMGRNVSGPFVRRAWLLPETSFADTQTTDGASYYYAVTAINAWGQESPKSAVLRVPSQDFTPPDPPSGLQVADLDREVGIAHLEWTSSDAVDLSGYRVYRQDEDGPHSPVTALLFAPRFEDRTLTGDGAFSYSVTAIDLAGNESEWSNIAPAPLDFFGSVLEVRRNFAGDGSIAIGTGRGRVDVAVANDTEVRVPNRPNATLRDLEVGDHVAVSLKDDAEGAVARQVHLVPTKTRNRHLAGRVSSLRETSIEIQPPGESSESSTFQLTDSVQIKLSPGIEALAEGQFVIASFVASDGQTAATLIELNVIPGPVTEEISEPPEEPTNVAEVRGVFQGINPENANIILSSTEVVLDVHTVMTAGVSVGDAVVVEALLQPDGSLLARRLEHDEGVGQVATRTILRGVFEGRDPDTGYWAVSGARILVDGRTYTDALPNRGQRVRVSSLVQGDGMLYAREVENSSETEDLDGEHSVFLEGILREITAQGAWDVGGFPIKVDANTVLAGRPSVGRRVIVAATARQGDLLATEVSAASSDQNDLVRSVNIRGSIDQVSVGQWLVVDGARIDLGDLTKVVGDVEVGSTVRVKAELQPDGSLLAREVAQLAAYDETGETRANPVDIEGRIERVGEDGSLVVNGIPVSVSVLTEVEAALQVGSPVQVRGLLQRDGSVLAREIVGFGAGVTGGTEASVAGVVERVDRDEEDNLVGLVVDGIAVSADRLTRVDVELTTGVAVVAQAIVIDGEILAVTVEPRPTGSIGVLPLVQMQGTIGRPFTVSPTLPADITVNGITVRISGETNIIGALSGGAVVKVTGSISGSTFLAREIERVGSFPLQGSATLVRFNLKGVLEEVRLDNEGQPESLLLDGNVITVAPLTVFQDEVSAGNSVIVEGIVRDEELLAALVRLS